VDRYVAFRLGPLELRIREVLEGFDDQVTVDLPHLHAVMSDISFSIPAVEVFRSGLAEVLSGDAKSATLDLSYSEGVYGTRVQVTGVEPDLFGVLIALSPDVVNSVTYAIAYDVSRSELETLLPQLAVSWR